MVGGIPEIAVLLKGIPGLFLQLVSVKLDEIICCISTTVWYLLHEAWLGTVEVCCLNRSDTRDTGHSELSAVIL